jgi:hypothetical protein
VIEMGVRAIEEDGPEYMINFIRSHENYSKVLSLAAEMRREMQGVRTDGKHRETFDSILRLMEKRPEEMTPRELAWLATFVVGPASLIKD